MYTINLFNQYLLRIHHPKIFSNEFGSGITLASTLLVGRSAFSFVVLGFGFAISKCDPNTLWILHKADLKLFAKNESEES